MKKIFLALTTLALISVACSKPSKQVSAEDVADTVTQTAPQQEAAPDTATGEVVLSAVPVMLTGDIAGRPAVIDFSATWCPPCRKLAPKFHEWEMQYGDAVTFITIDVDQYPELADAYDVQSIPCLLFYPAANKTVDNGRNLVPGQQSRRIEGLDETAILSEIKKLANK